MNEGIQIDEFNAKLNGNNHTISNINLNEEFLIESLSGTIQNLYINNVKQEVTSYLTILPIPYPQYGGLIRYLRQSSTVDNVHISNIEIKADSGLDDAMNSSYVGALAANAYLATVTNSSVNNFTITLSDRKCVGGLVGYANGIVMENCYSSNINIVDPLLNSQSVIGGILGDGYGYNESVILRNCYASGTINGGGTVGGIIGSLYPNNSIENCYSIVNIESEGDMIGGVIGEVEDSRNSFTISNNLNLGNLYSPNEDNIGRVIGVSEEEITGVNYAYNKGLICGYISSDDKGAVLLSYDEVMNFDLGDEYQYSNADTGILPKLYNTEGTQLLPNQSDIIINNQNIIEVESIIADKINDEEANISILLTNENEVEITGVEISDLEYEITRNITENGQTNIVLHVRPERYYDSYKLTKIIYKINDTQEEIDFNTKIDLQFFKNIYSFEDWQSIEEGTYQNYLLMADIDFSGRTNVKNNISVNRLEANSMKTLKNIELTFDETKTGFIKEVKSSLRNIKFENIKITNTYDVRDQFSLSFAEDTYSGVVAWSIGIVENVEFSNIEVLCEKGVDSSGAIGRADLEYARNIKLKDIHNKGCYVGGLSGVMTADYVSNIQAENIELEGVIYQYAFGNAGGDVGGIIGYSYVDNFSNISIKNCNIANASPSGGIAGYQTGCESVSNVQVEDLVCVSSGDAGGLFGQSWGINCVFSNIYTKNVEISAGSDAGGIAGYGYVNISDSYINVDIKSCKENAGGIAGNGSLYGANNIMILDSTINSDQSAGVLYGTGNGTSPASNIYFDADIQSGQTNKNILIGKSTNNTMEFSNIVAYRYNEVNGEYIYETTTNIEDIKYLIRDDLNNEDTYTDIIGLGDLWDYSTVSSGKYPILKNMYIPEWQEGIELPVDPEGVSANMLLLEETDGAQDQDLETINYDIYPISAYEINIDFEYVPENAHIEYYVNGEKIEEVDFTEKTYTFEYNFEDELEIVISNGVDEKNITVNPDDIKSEISLVGDNYAYLIGNNLYVNSELQEGEYVNVYSGYAMLRNSSQVLDLSSGKVVENSVKTALEETSKPLHTYEYKENIIESYGTYSKVNGNVKLQIYNVRNGILSAISNDLDIKIDNYIVDNYNGKEYQTILTNSGEIVDLKEILQYPENFLNRNVKQIVQNNNVEKPEMMVLYNTGKVIVFNYSDGNIIYETEEKSDEGLTEYITGSLNSIWSNYESKQEEYLRSKELVEKLSEMPVEEILNETQGKENNSNTSNIETSINISNTNDTSTSTNVNVDSYITVYNGETGEYEVYSEEEILEGEEEDPVSETEKIKTNGLESVYNYEQEEETGTKVNGAIIVGTIIGIAIISLIILRKIMYKNNQKNNSK